MKKKLTLTSEHLAELATDDLRTAVAGTYSGNPFCVLSVTAPCHTGMCTQDVRCLLQN